MSKTFLILMCRTNTSIHRDSTVYIAVPCSSRWFLNDSFGFTRYEVHLQTFECNFWFTLVAPHFSIVCVERFLRLFPPSFLLLRAWTFVFITFLSIPDLTFANANLFLIIFVYCLLFKYLLFLYLNLRESV